ncbi:uncharacterized protein LY89DRAFT_671863 [Mollisia scopiformis]|uniref:Uncharacterized protein n=1 Tax=Mollisia scopiformis TaxID=149040 RepID=A0A194X2W3_MOLSC|nr:uncharacterized protein LY89DRAFT_671863 [Mollisia scopiformis]KUJ14525.1 hypothetical protein LY89DRAFT_671863 [Mollisia scopiformis]
MQSHMPEDDDVLPATYGTMNPGFNPMLDIPVSRSQPDDPTETSGGSRRDPSIKGATRDAEELAVITEVPPHETRLEDKLFDAVKVRPQVPESYFIPPEEIRRLVTIDSILSELQRCGIGFAQTELQQKAEEIARTARNLFAVLVCHELGECILDFLNEGVCDEDMPFVRVRLEKRDGRAGRGLFKLESRRHKGRVLKCMATTKWTRANLEGLLRDQCWVLEPKEQEGAQADEEGRASKPSG